MFLSMKIAAFYLEDIMKLKRLICMLVLCGSFSALHAQIHEAVEAGDMERVNAILVQNPDQMLKKNEKGNTPLHVAAAGGYAAIVRLLLDKGADLQALGEYGFTPLHTALVARQREIVKILIERGADVNALDRFGRPPLIWVPWFTDDVESADLLIQKGADVNFVTVEGASAFNTALYSDRRGLIRLFLERGVRLPEDETTIRDYLNSCASSGNMELFARLLQAGGNLHFKNRFGGSLLHQAASGGAHEMAEMLIARGLPVDGMDRYGLTPLHIAASKGGKAVVEILMAHDADPDIRSRDGRSAYNMADKAGKKETADLLRKNGVDIGPQKFPVLKGEYVGQKPPERIPELFAPGIVSQNKNEHSMLVFGPDMDEIYWSPEYGAPITFMKRINNRWTAPRPVSFTFDRLDSEPVMSQDGKKLFFLSRRPVDENDEREKERIWVVERQGYEWGDPKPVERELTTHWQFSIAGNGTLYFGGNGDSPREYSDIYRSRCIDGKYSEPENLGPAVNSEHHDMQPYIDPEERFIIISRLGADPGGRKGLYISYQKSDGTWTAAQRMSETVNDEGACNPYVSPDGKVLFFSRNNDYYWVSTQGIDELKKH